MRWFGWGQEGSSTMELPEAAGRLLGQRLGVAERHTPPVVLEEVRLPEPALGADALARLRGVVGQENVRDDRDARVLHAAGRSYPDLVRLRSGDGSGAPDAVVYPADRERVAAVLSVCSDAGIAVIPFGGGTSVVGGVEALRGDLSGAITLDLSRMDGLVNTDRTSLTATFQPGVTGPRAETLLASCGLTLGHFPQSFEFATIGGYVATRSAGQASTGYGRIDELVLGLRCATPSGELELKPFPATAAGPSLLGLLVGSEGTLGVITEATLAVRPLPEASRYEGWSFRSFEEGREAFRAMEQAEASPEVARLSDESETALSMALGSRGTVGERAGRAYLRLRGHEQGCIAIVGWEGAEAEIASRRLRGRHSGPYLRVARLDRGVMAETLETATTWSRLGELYKAVGDALRDALSARGTPPLVMCHVSHLYRSGASLYYTFIAAQEQGAELDQWRAAKQAASDAIVAHGGTITHHHAVGRDHAPWMRAEVGDLGVELLRAAKERLDPRGIMNPGKLLPDARLQS